MRQNLQRTCKPTVRTANDDFVAGFPGFYAKACREDQRAYKSVSFGQLTD